MCGVFHLLTGLSLMSCIVLGDNHCTVLSDKTANHAKCACKATNGQIFSLWDLVKSANTRNPLFKDIESEKTSDKSAYDYEPCRTFTETAPCTDVAVCQHVGGDNYATGKIPTNLEELYSGDPLSSDPQKQLNFTYTSGEGEEKRTSVVMMRCAKTQKFEALGETSEGSKKYEFKLHTPLMCPSTLSTGSILLIIFFVLVVLYLAIGTLYLRFGRGARGVEQIPNYEFWTDLPLAIKEGIVFTFNGCKTDTTYSQI